MVVGTLLSFWRALLLALAPLPHSEEHTELTAGHCVLPKEIMPTFQVYLYNYNYNNVIRMCACPYIQSHTCIYIHAWRMEAGVPLPQPVHVS